MRHRILGTAVSFTVAACALPHFEHDPNAVAPRFDRWEAAVAALPDSAYAAALGVIVEEGYTIGLASRADRVVTTNLRLRYTGYGLSGTSHYIRFTLLVRPTGADSARITVTGEDCFGEELTACTAVTAHDGGPIGAWQFVRRLGEATLIRLAAERPAED
jgi:hypothetical protein